MKTKKKWLLLVLLAVLFGLALIKMYWDELKNEKDKLIGGVDERRLRNDGDYCTVYTLTGTVFRDKRTILTRNKVKMCHLKTFGADLTERCRKEFVDLHNNITVMLRSPSLMWFNEDLILTLRIRISKVPNKRHDCWGFHCNHIYLQKYDKFLNPIGQRDIISLRSPIEADQKERTGPHDPRLFQVNNSMYSLFATGYKESWISGVWDYKKQRHFLPEFQQQLILQKGEIIYEKNWVPIIIKDDLHIVRHLDPLQVMKCKIHEKCTFVKNDTDAMNYHMDAIESPLRGGTAFEVFRYPYYVGFGHATYFDNILHFYRYYTVHLIVLCVDPFRIVYVSDPVQIHPGLYANYSGPSIWEVVKGDFFFPTGLMSENVNSLVIGAHVNDKASMLLRMEGVQGLVDNVIKMDSRNANQKDTISIQKYLLHRAQQLKLTNILDGVE